MEVCCLNHWTTREVPQLPFFLYLATLTSLKSFSVLYCIILNLKEKKYPPSLPLPDTTTVIILVDQPTFHFPVKAVSLTCHPYVRTHTHTHVKLCPVVTTGTLPCCHAVLTIILLVPNTILKRLSCTTIRALETSVKMTINTLMKLASISCFIFFGERVMNSCSSWQIMINCPPWEVVQIHAVESSVWRQQLYHTLLNTVNCP